MLSDGAQIALITGLCGIAGVVLPIVLRRMWPIPASPGPAAPPSRLLMFISTSALLLAMSALVLVYYFRPSPVRLPDPVGYTSTSFVICGLTANLNSAGGSCGRSITRVDSSTPATEHHVPMHEVPEGGRIVGGWYTLFDAVSALSQFDQIEVLPDGDKQLKVLVRMNPGGEAAFMRIQVHAIYVMGGDSKS